MKTTFFVVVFFFNKVNTRDKAQVAEGDGVVTSHGGRDDGSQNTPWTVNTSGRAWRPPVVAPTQRTEDSKENQVHTPTVIQAACCSSPTLSATTAPELMPAAGGGSHAGAARAQRPGPGRISHFREGAGRAGVREKVGCGAD